MQDKVTPKKQFLMLLYGYPGSGKTTFAKNFTGEMPIIHFHGEKFQHDLHEISHGQAMSITSPLMQYMALEFLKTGTSVIFDANLTKRSERNALRNLAKRTDADVVLVWLQIDRESAFNRTQNRDRRKNEDKYANSYSASAFDSIINESQNPDKEDYVVISGKHTFHTQRGTVMKKLFELGLITQEAANQKVVKPGLMNLVPQHVTGRGEFTRRNISIR